MPRERPSTSPVLAESQPTPTPVPANAWSLSLSSIFLTITLISVCLGVLVQVPGLGIPLSFLSFFAIIRAFDLGRRKKVEGGRLSTLGKLNLFLNSLALMVLAVGAAGIAFFLACLATLGLTLVSTGISSPNEGLIYLSLFVSVIVALAAGGWVLYELWRPQRWK